MLLLLMVPLLRGVHSATFPIAYYCSPSREPYSLSFIEFNFITSNMLSDKLDTGCELFKLRADTLLEAYGKLTRLFSNKL